MLRAGRLERGLSEEQLGARIGQSAKEISRYESGQSIPDPKVMASLAAELKLSSPVTDAHYVPKHSAEATAPAALDPEPARETLTVDGAVPSLPPVPPPSEEPQPEEPNAAVPSPFGPSPSGPSPFGPSEPDGSPSSWSGVRPWADPTRVLAEVPVEDSILPVDEPPFPNGPRPADGRRSAEWPQAAMVSPAFVALAPPLPEDETRRNPTVDVTVATPKTVPDRPRSYLDLPGERTRYRGRAIVTLLGLAALVYVIGWAMGRAGDLFDAILDTIRAVT
jgi:transcriptional regulator with XRE-family HTH domain